MNIKLRTKDGVEYLAESTPIKTGGEGAIHKVLSSKGPPLVVKIWHDPGKAVGARKRIEWMIDNSPVKSASQSLQNSIIWPRDLIFRNRRFIGYTMSMVPEAIKLFSMIQPGFPDLKFGMEWDKYTMPAELRSRLIVCYNLSQAVGFLHKSGNFRVVDMKPENILVKPNGHISLIDMDSIQINDNNGMLFPATVFTPEYSPPEFHQTTFVPGVTRFSREHDLFSLAVILYQILVNVHPFQASHHKNTAVHENIIDGLWAHGSRKNQLHSIPRFHNFFVQLPLSIRDLFRQTFDAGHANRAQRVHPDEWATTLLKEMRLLKNPTRPHRKATSAAPKQKPAAKKKKKSAKKQVITQNRVQTVTHTSNSVTQSIQVIINGKTLVSINNIL